jgi:hypothetical protein
MFGIDRDFFMDICAIAERESVQPVNRIRKYAKHTGF